MKALTIHEPWATLLALGLKRYETRPWYPREWPQIGEIWIHAGKTWCDEYQELCASEPFKSALASRHVIDIPQQLSRGKVIAVARVVAAHPSLPLRGTLERECNTRELAFGNFLPGRWCWELSSVRRLANPVAIAGQQGPWDFEPPAGWRPVFV